MTHPLLRLSACIAAALVVAACGGSDGATGPQGPSGPPGPTGPTGPAAPNAVILTANTPAATFAALDIQASVTSVTINPASATTNPGTVVNFKLTERTTGAVIVGFGQKAKCFPRNNTTTPYVGDCYPNLAFTLAKLVPGSGGTPSKWVNYIVVGAPTVSGGTTSARTLQAPSTENNGTLVDNGDGTYKYTFYNDITGVAALVAGITPPTGRDKNDLGDVSFVAGQTHRLVIQIAGNAPGTGSNNSTGLATGFPTGVPLAKAVDVIYDFVPATGQAPAASANRKMVANANCESCHSTLGGLPGDSSDAQNGLQFHGGSRNNIEYCVICHTDQRRYGNTEATWNSTTRAFTSATNIVDGRTIGSAPNFLHKIHVAGVMTKTNYNYANVLFDKGGYSQDIRNCDKCHDSTGASTGGTPLPQAALWKTNANRQACGSCHDGINFDTGLGLTLADKAAGKTSSTDFFGKAHPDNSTDGTCLNSSCHNAGAPGDPDLVHKPVTPPNTKSFLHVADGTGNNNTNSAWIASNTNRLPEGAIKVSYEIKSVSRNATTGYPEMVFRMLQNGAAVDLNDPANPASVNPATGQPEIWPNFMGAPSVYFVFSVPQDNVAKPVDFNSSVSLYLRCLWNGTAGTTACGTSGATSSAGGTTASTPAGSLVKITSGADAGYYRATINRVIPTNAVMLTGGLGYSYGLRTTFPLTQTNLAAYPVSAPLAAVGGTPETTTTLQLYPGMPNRIGGLIVIAPNVQVVASGYTGRRAIVDDKRCNDCHQELGTFTEDAFHAGQRNDGSTCAWCHTPNRPAQGWSVDSTYFVHAIHAAGKRNAKFTYDATSYDPATQTGEGFFDVKYPGVLARCTQCHKAGTFDFTASDSANAAGLGTSGGDSEIDKRLFRTVAAGNLTATAGTLAAFQLSPYIVNGTNYGSNFSFNIATGATTIASATTLVMSPTVAVCAACHDSTLARSHMELNGGSFYRSRTDVFGSGYATALPGAAVPLKVEQCFVCHASGRTAGITQVHAR